MIYNPCLHFPAPKTNVPKTIPKATQPSRLQASSSLHARSKSTNTILLRCLSDLPNLSIYGNSASQDTRIRYEEEEAIKQCNMNDDRSYRQTYLKNCSAHVKKGGRGDLGLFGNTCERGRRKVSTGPYRVPRPSGYLYAQKKIEVEHRQTGRCGMARSEMMRALRPFVGCVCGCNG